MNKFEIEQFIRSISLKRDKIKSYDNYPFNIPLIKDLKALHFHPKVTYIVGENGTGKSTLLEAIAIANGFNPEGGTTFFNFKTTDSHSDLHNYLKIVRGTKRPKTGFFLRSESFYNVASEIERVNATHNYGHKSLHEQSHGESFFSLMQNRFSDSGLYILDEPEAALSPNRQLAMLGIIHDLAIQKSQFIIATHAPIVLAYPDSKIYQINNNRLIETLYEDTESYNTTKQFISHRQQMLDVILD